VRAATGDMIRLKDQPHSQIREVFAMATYRPLW
jgi:hypothetical protein